MNCLKHYTIVASLSELFERMYIVSSIKHYNLWDLVALANIDGVNSKEKSKQSCISWHDLVYYIIYI